MIVACVGDSITRANVSADYVGLLRDRLAGDDVDILRFGVNGNLAWNVLQRLDDVIACRPDVVTLLIGTNDVNATFNEAWRARYVKVQHLPQAPSLTWYRENVAGILERLRAQTDARLVVLDLPPLGEDLASVMNTRVAEYNEALSEVCAEHEVPCLPLNAALIALLPQGHRPPPYAGDRRMIVTALLRHLVLRRSWDQVSQRNGLAVLTDHIHVNGRGAGVVADLIAQELAKSSDY